MPGSGRAVKTGRTRPWPMPHWSRDGMSEASAIYCRGRADGVRGDEATYLSMTARHGHSRRARRPHATAPCLQQLRLAQPQEKCHGSVGAPTLPRSAALPPGPARCPHRALPAIRPRAGLHPKKDGSDREPWRGRLQPSRRAEQAFFQGHGTGAVCSGFAAIALPGAAEEGGRSGAYADRRQQCLGAAGP